MFSPSSSTKNCLKNPSGAGFSNVALLKKLKNISVHIGDKGTVEELVSLDKQAHELTELLVEWNDAFRHPGQFKVTDKGLEMVDLISSAQFGSD